MRKVVIALAATFTLVACGGENGEDRAAGGTATTPTPTPTETEPEATPVDGTWSALEITAQDARAAIEAQGFGRAEFDAFWDEMGASESLGLTIKLQDDSYTLFGSTDGADPDRWDQGSYTVEGDIFTFQPPSGGTTTHRWTIEGDRLEFELLESTEPDPGLPIEVFAAAFFTSEPFVRVAG